MDTIFVHTLENVFYLSIFCVLPSLSLIYLQSICTVNAFSKCTQIIQMIRKISAQIHSVRRCCWCRRCCAFDVGHICCLYNDVCLGLA